VPEVTSETRETTGTRDADQRAGGFPFASVFFVWM
jgi:hypothetical protein